jgi:eukaryotic-like serine/threonine-protein kinase
MRTPGLLLRLVAQHALRALLNLDVDLGADLPSVATAIGADVWDAWSGQTTEAQRLAEVEALVATPAVEVRATAAAVAAEVAAAQPPAVRERLTTYLLQLPATVHQTLRRPSDPRGVTLPPSLRLQRSEDLVALLPARPSRFKPGDRPLPGVDWELVELLGVGGFGEVWKAKNPHLASAEPVALKFCLDSMSAMVLRNEAAVLDRVMRQGKHSGIVTLRHTYLSATPPCLEYEYVEGGDLAGLIQEWHKNRGGPSGVKAATLIVRLAEAVGFAHFQSPPIVHRDLKPANVLVQPTSDGKFRLRVADFGIGGIAFGQVTEKTRRGTQGPGTMLTAVRGSYTPLYASPQQMRGEAPDPRDDVYALGVIWYQLLTGEGRGVRADSSPVLSPRTARRRSPAGRRPSRRG